MTDIYASRGYGLEPQGFGEKPALLVVDFQRGFTDPAYPMGGSAAVDAAVEATRGVMRAAKRAGAPVLACVISFDSRKAAPLWKVAPVLDLAAIS